MSVLVAADCHLASGAWAHRPITGDAYWALHCLVELAKERRPDWILLAGDVLDKGMTGSEPIWALRDAIRQLPARTRVGFIQGDHEWQRRPWLSLLDVEWLHRRTISIDGRTWMGMDYVAHSAELKEALKEVECDVLLTHQKWAETVGERSGRASLADLRCCPCVVSGDLHLMVERFYELGGLPPRAYYSPGSMAMQSIDEPVEKGCWFFPSSGRPSPLIWPSRRRIDLPEVKTSDQLEAALTVLDEQLRKAAEYAATFGLPGDLRQPLVRVRVNVDLPTALRRLEEACQGKAHLFAERWLAEASFRVEEGGSGRSEWREFAEQMLCGESRGNEAMALLERLLGAESISEELRRARQEKLRGD